MVSETTPMVLAEGHYKMALGQTAWLEVLDALKGADAEDRIKQAATTIYQALIEAELTAVISASRTPAQRRRNSATKRTPAGGDHHHGR